MNIENINRVIVGVQDTDYPFDMDSYKHCISGVVTRLFGDEFYTSGVAEAFGISHDEAYELTMPDNIKYFSATRAQAVIVLQHLRDTGKVDWSVAYPGIGAKIKNYFQGLVSA